MRWFSYLIHTSLFRIYAFSVNTKHFVIIHENQMCHISRVYNVSQIHRLNLIYVRFNPPNITLWITLFLKRLRIPLKNIWGNKQPQFTLAKIVKSDQICRGNLVKGEGDWVGLNWCMQHYMHSWMFTTTVCFNISRPRQNCCHFTDDMFKCIFLNENVSFAMESLWRACFRWSN